MTSTAEGPAPDDERTRDSFTRQVPQFARPDAVYASDALASWVVATLSPLDPTMRVLEVACGAGHAAEAVAAHGGRVEGIDLTPALIEQGRRRLAEHGVGNVILKEGDARATGFRGATFDVVFCRLAVHHFPEPAEQIAEMARVCRPGGLVAVFDITAVDPATREALDELDRRIDPSHTRRLRVEELVQLLEDHVGPVVSSSSDRRSAPLERYLSGLDAPAEVAADVRDAVARELAGGASTGLCPSSHSGQIWVATQLSAVAARCR